MNVKVFHPHTWVMKGAAGFDPRCRFPRQLWECSMCKEQAERRGVPEPTTFFSCTYREKAPKRFQGKRAEE